MTKRQCIRCGKFWLMHTLWPNTYRSISKFCPHCIAVVYPVWKDTAC